MRLYGSVDLPQEEYGSDDTDTKDGNPNYANVGQSPVYHEHYGNEQDKEASDSDAKRHQYPRQHPSVLPRARMLQCSTNDLSIPMPL